MNLDEMQQRLQDLFLDKQKFEHQAEQIKHNCIMLQGHIGELSFLIQEMATPAALLETDVDTEELNQPMEQIA